MTDPGTAQHNLPAFRVPWRHFLLTIVSPSILTFGLFLLLIFGFIVPEMKRQILDRKRETLRELVQVSWSELHAPMVECGGQMVRHPDGDESAGRV